MSLAIWSLAAQNVSLYPLVPGGTKCFNVPFGPWRDKMFHCTLWSLAAQNVSLYLLVSGGTKCFIIPFGPMRLNVLTKRTACLNTNHPPITMALGYLTLFHE